MKAVVIREFGPPDAHRAEEVSDPVVAGHQVLIDVKAADVNFPAVAQAGKAPGKIVLSFA